MKKLIVLLLLAAPLYAQVGEAVKLTWDASTFPPTGGGYNVFRKDGAAGTFAKINTALLTANNYTDATALAGRSYIYAVTAVVGTVESSRSNEVTVAVKPLVVLPVAPTGLIATCGNGGTTADFRWTIPANANGSNLRVHEDGIDVKDQTKYIAYFDNIPDTSRSFSIPPGRKIIWWVHASNSAGMGPSANSSFTCTLPAPTNLKVAVTTIPPSASIRKGTIPVTVEATDSARLDLLINNTQVATSAAGFITYSWFPKKKMRYLLMGRAEDAAGNRVQATKVVEIR